MNIKNRRTTIKNSRFPISLFAIYYGILLLMAGLHTGLVVLANEQNWSEITQIMIPVIYWGLVAAGLTFFTRNKMRDTYEEPMHKLAEAATKVANGDFSVYQR